MAHKLTAPQRDLMKRIAAYAGTIWVGLPIDAADGRVLPVLNRLGLATTTANGLIVVLTDAGRAALSK